jgi:hypothetical protein
MSLYLARVDVISTGGVHYEIRDEEGMIALMESVAATHGDDAVVTSTQLEDHEVEALESLRRTDPPLYRFALVDLSSRGG